MRMEHIRFGKRSWSGGGSRRSIFRPSMWRRNSKITITSTSSIRGSASIKGHFAFWINYRVPRRGDGVER